MSVQNLTSRDPFADLGGEESLLLTESVVSKSKDIHIRIQQRNGRKSLTTLQGLPEEYDPKKILQAFKKQFSCNGTLIPHLELGTIIQLQGDQRNQASKFLSEVGIPANTIKSREKLQTLRNPLSMSTTTEIPILNADETASLPPALKARLEHEQEKFGKDVTKESIEKELEEAAARKEAEDALKAQKAHAMSQGESIQGGAQNDATSAQGQETK